MKNSKSFLLALLVLIATDVNMATGEPTSFKPEKQESKASKQKLTVDMLNCKPGVYKTYEDFVNGAPLNLAYQDIEVKFDAGEKITSYLVIFKDEHGARVEMSPTEFWGFTSFKHHLCRSVNYTYRSLVPKVCFWANFVTEDLIIYEPCVFERFGNFVFFPRKWYSDDLSSPVEGDINYYKTHDKNKVKKLEDAWLKCNRSGIKSKDMNAWYRSILDCYDQIPGFIAVFDEMVKFKPHDPSKYMR